MQIAFIGAGVMGEAVISGLLRQGLLGPNDIWVSDVAPGRLDSLGDRYRVNCTSDNLEAARGREVVVLSIKPRSLAEVMAELEGQLQPEQLAFSIVAGASIALLSQGLGHSAVVRVMPNLPAQIGQGVSVWTAADGVGQAQREAARTILSALGREVYVADEKYIDMATAVSGSGPAYIFLVIEALIDAGVHLGLPRELATELVLDTVLGSARLVQELGKHPAELRDMVTSPGGTTAEGLLQLEMGGLRAILAQAIIAAYGKAQALKTPTIGEGGQ